MESCSSYPHLLQIQAQLTCFGLISHRFPASRVIAFCALSDPPNMSHAAGVLPLLSEPPNSYILNTIIRGYNRSSSPHLALSLFIQIIQSNYRNEVDARTFVFALKACEQLADILVGNQVHCVVSKLGFDADLLANNGLLHFYVEFGIANCTRKLFAEMSRRDVVSWTTLIDGYAQMDLPIEALRLFNSMTKDNILPNDATLIAALSACSRLGVLGFGKTIHGFIVKRDDIGSINLWNTLVDMYGKCGCIESSRRVFDSMLRKDVFTWTSLMNAYAKCGSVELAKQVFDEMPEKNVISWSSMIAAYTHADLPNEALELFHDMVAVGVEPIGATLVSVVAACAQSGSLNLGKWIYEHYIDQKGLKLSVNLANAFIEMYAKCGAIDVAAELFSNLEVRNIVSWNTMIMAYAVHGFANNALNLFEQIKSTNMMPDDITFLAVLSACCHAGLVEQGQKHFKDMKVLFGIEPKAEHYSCLIDLLAKCGLYEDSYKLVSTMSLELGKEGWGALLSACRMHGNVGLGKHLGDKLLGLDPGDSGIYALLANIYAARNKWDDVRRVRNLMRDKGVRKTPGCSSLEVDGKFHKFFSAGKSHVQSDEIDIVLDKIYSQLGVQETGIVCEEKYVLCGESDYG